MCIIVAKPSGVVMPDMETLKTCFDNNSDGAGFMIANGKTVSIQKGFMTFERFYDSITSLGNLTDSSVVMHFRIATHGDVKPSCCHPFPVTDDFHELSSTETENRICVAHNGVIQGMRTDKNTSDTMAYISSVLAPLRRISEDFMHNDNALDVIQATVGSKLCFLDNSGDIVLVGNFLEHEGCFYSNDSYAKRSWNFSSYKSSIWDDGYEDWWKEKAAANENNLGDMIGLLPFYSCADCPDNTYCALDCPYCKSEHEAAEMVDYLYEMSLEEYAEMYEDDFEKSAA